MQKVLLIENVLPLLEALGTLAFAISGIAEARKKRMDIVGVFSAAMVASFGGGTLRDLLLGVHPFYWIKNDHWPLILLVLAIGSKFWPTRGTVAKKTMLSVEFFDAMGLGLFSAIGMTVALNQGVAIHIAIMMGVMTGAFGGVLRDILCNEIPILFKDPALYASAAVIGLLGYALVMPFFADPLFPMLIGATLIFVIRLLAFIYQWKLPNWLR